MGRLLSMELRSRLLAAIDDGMSCRAAATAYSFRMCYGIQFTTPGAGGSTVLLIKEMIANGEIFRAHAFEYTCARNDIEHRTTRVWHPWTNGQVERMKRTIKDATINSGNTLLTSS